MSNQNDELNAETQLAHLAAQCWFSGIVAHKREAPEQCDKLVELIGANKATPFVMVAPGHATQCGVRITGTQECIIFATMTVTEAKPDWLN